ncbi:MAG: SHOCT domain-containing protein [Terracoccus sp.]
MMWGYGMGWGGWLLMGLMMVGFWALVVAAIVAAFRSSSRSEGSGRFGRTGRDARDGGDAAARRILDERFARGEIDEQDYTARLGVLGGTR